VRVGIATGLVVAGDLIGKGAVEGEAVVGETPNLAARLQALAGPGTVLIGSRTQRWSGVASGSPRAARTCSQASVKRSKCGGSRGRSPNAPISSSCASPRTTGACRTTPQAKTDVP